LSGAGDQLSEGVRPGAGAGEPGRAGTRPDRLVVVVGTGTSVGKTFVTSRLVTELVATGRRVAVRKPVQSYDPGDDPATTDAGVLGAASGEPAEVVCPPERWYPAAMAPPMAAEALGRQPVGLDELVAGVRWPVDPIDVGLVETAGGVRSPLALDGDAVSLCRMLEPDAVVLVAEAGLGAINIVRLSVGVLEAPTVVALNRFDVTSDLHRRNLEWMRRVDGLRVVALPGDETELVRFAAG
jgi:dethiobiotin synthetase